MKKLLFLLLAMPFAANAGEWDWDVSGQAYGLYGYSAYSKPDKGHPANNHTPFYGEINTMLGYSFNDDYQLSAHLDINGGADRALKDYNQGSWGEEAYLIGDSPFGRLMGGQTYNVAYQFHVGAPQAGIMTSNNNYLVDFIKNPNWRRDKHATRFGALNSTALNTDGVAAKISYISPEFYGTTLGISYVPESYNRRGLINKAAPYENNAGYIAAVYNQSELGYYTVETSLAYAFYDEIDQEISAGLKVSRGGWSVGGSLHQSKKDGKTVRDYSLPADFDGFRDGFAWDAGIGYEIGPFSTALSYFYSHSDEADAENEVISFSNEYQINKYVNVYLTAAHVDFRLKSGNLEEKTSGYAFISGIGVNF